MEYDDDSEGRLADKTCDNNGEESIQSNVSKKERGANKGTPKSSESSLQVENPLEEVSFFSKFVLHFSEFLNVYVNSINFLNSDCIHNLLI